MKFCSYEYDIQLVVDMNLFLNNFHARWTQMSVLRWRKLHIGQESWTTAERI